MTTMFKRGPSAVTVCCALLVGRILIEDASGAAVRLPGRGNLAPRQLDTGKTRRQPQKGRQTTTLAPTTDEDGSLPYFWMCPELSCPDLPEGCSTVEFFVFEHEHEIRGKLVRIRCQSCQYCMDGPSGMTSRKRRSTYSHAAATLRNLCHHLECPAVPATCSDIRLTNVLMGGHRCKHCDACYDRMLLSDVPGSN